MRLKSVTVTYAKAHVCFAMCTRLQTSRDIVTFQFTSADRRPGMGHTLGKYSDDKAAEPLLGRRQRQQIPAPEKHRVVLEQPVFACFVTGGFVCRDVQPTWIGVWDRRKQLGDVGYAFYSIQAGRKFQLTCRSLSYTCTFPVLVSLLDKQRFCSLSAARLDANSED